MQVRVYLIERDGRRRLSVSKRLSRLEGDIRLVGAARDVAEAAESLDAARANVVLLAWQGSGPATVRASKALRDACPAAGLLILSESEAPRDLVRLLEAGARGVLGRGSDSVTFAAALDAAAHAQGGVLLDPARTEGLLSYLGILPEETPPAPGATLTGREQEVLALLSRGETYGSVAESLGIGLGTVQSHVKSIYRKLSVGSKTAAARAALDHGLTGT